jgi:hypothetical protein
VKDTFARRWRSPEPLEQGIAALTLEIPSHEEQTNLAIESGRAMVGRVETGKVRSRRQDLNLLRGNAIVFN